MLIIDLQQCSVIRYCVLHHKYNYQIQAKLCLVYGKDVLCLRIVDTLAIHFWSGRTSIEDDESPGRPSRDDFWATAFDYWEKKLYISCREIIKELLVLRIIILQALEK
jgi:hypothetical protein